MLERFKHLHPLIYMVYLPRAVGYLLVFSMLAILIHQQDRSDWLWVFAIWQGLLWPHVAFLISSFSTKPKYTELTFLLWDSFTIGIWIGVMYYNPWLGATLSVSFLMASMGIQGLRTYVPCLAIMLIGLFVGGLLTGFQVELQTTLALTLLCILCLLVFTGVTGWVTFARSSKLRSTRKTLMKTHEELVNVNAVLQAASSTLELDKVMDSVMSALQGVFVFDTISIQLKDAKLDVLKFHAIYGKYNSESYIDAVKSIEVHLHTQDSVTGKVYNSMKEEYFPKLSPELPMLPIDRRIFELKPFLSLIVLPIVSKGESIGVISFLSHYGHFDLKEDEIKMIKQYINQISIVLNNAMLFSQTKLDQIALNEKNKQLENLSKQLSRYMSPQVFENIFSGKKEVKIESYRKRLTIFFSDIAGFTELTDRIESEVLTNMLNTYLNDMSEIAIRYGGTIDKYIGDAIMIFFGDPETRGVKEDAIQCVRMAIDMQHHIKEVLVKKWVNDGIPETLKIRIGINSGFTTVGNFGSEYRMDYTLVGSQVNIASRLQSNAPLGEILISEETYILVKDAIICEKNEDIFVKGISHPIKTYLVKGGIS